MTSSFRLYRNLMSLGFSPEQADIIAETIVDSQTLPFDGEAVADRLVDSGCSVEMADVISEVLQNCFASERFATYYDQSRLKAKLVRAKLDAVRSEAFLAAIDPFIVTARNAEKRIAVKQPPKEGEVFMCDFTYLRKPEMQKQRRAVVISPRGFNRHGRCCVVPVSKSPPRNLDAHIKFLPNAYPFFHSEEPVWAVCDHIYTVSFTRLWLINIRRTPKMVALRQHDLEDIRRKVASTLGIVALSASGNNDITKIPTTTGKPAGTFADAERSKLGEARELPPQTLLNL